MPEGVSELFAKKKKARIGGVEVTDVQRDQARSLFGQVTRGEGPDTEAVATAAPSAPRVERPASPTVVVPENPTVIETEVAKEAAVEDEWGEDPLALVGGEEDIGLLGEKVAADATSIYASDNPHPLELFEALSRDFNRLEWAVWEPEAIAAAIQDDFGVKPSPMVMNMIGALAALVESEAFWNEHHLFLQIVTTLNGSIPNFAILPDVTPEEVAFAVGVAQKVRDEEPLELPDGSTIPGVRLDPQVLATIAAVFHMNGLVYAPAPLEGVNEHLEKLHDASARQLASEVKQMWGVASEEDVLDLGDLPLDLQVGRLAAIREYVRNPHA